MAKPFPDVTREAPDISVEQILDDLLHIYEYLKGTVGITNKELIIFGRSIGSGLAL